MGINSTEVSYGFGQLGSVFCDTTAAVTPPTGKAFVAITMLTDCTFDSSGGLVADNNATAGLEYMGTETAAHNLSVGSETTSSGGGGAQIDVSNIFPAGMTIYGRWTEIEANSGSFIAYIGA